MNATTVQDKALPWYRHGWVWFLIAIPLAAVLGGIATVIIAVRSDDGVVAADYYRRGLAINEQLARQQRARELGLTGALAIEGLAAGDRVRLRLAAEQRLPPEATVQVRLVHPGRAGADRAALLARSRIALDEQSAEYVGTWQEVGAGAVRPEIAWQVLVETPTWQLQGDAPALPSNAEVRLRARETTEARR
ncbi:MAG: FixH family protein [Burkholderiaceae bacterium]|nr:FixH family protein [Burkholderiaceae bacterium]